MWFSPVYDIMEAWLAMSRDVAGDVARHRHFVAPVSRGTISIACPYLGLLHARDIACHYFSVFIACQGYIACLLTVIACLEYIECPYLGLLHARDILHATTLGYLLLARDILHAPT